MRKKSKIGSQPYVLALDISSVCIGWAAFTADGTLHSHGRWLTPSGGHAERFSAFQAWLTERLEALQVMEICVEWPFHGIRRNAFAVLIQYCAIAQLVYWTRFGRELPDSSRVPAAEVKRSLGLVPSRVTKNKRHEDNKRRIVRWVNANYGLRLKFVAKDAKKRRTQDDEADAIALGVVWFARKQHDE